MIKIINAFIIERQVYILFSYNETHLTFESYAQLKVPG